MPLDTQIRHLKLNDESFPAVMLGAGPPVLLLHGFPDSHRLWRHQIEALVTSGFQVVAPDLRGFGDAPRPAEVIYYRRFRIMEDVLAILNLLSIPKVHLVGHDWGADLAWRLAGFHCERVLSLSALSVGSPRSPGWDTIEQREKSWYFDFFLKPGVAEAALMANNWQLFREWSRGQGDHSKHLLDLARPGALTAALNWYRGSFTPRAADEPRQVSALRWRPIHVPVLGIWSDEDPFLLEAQMRRSGETVDGYWRYERVSEAGHWLMLDRPDQVSRLLVQFLSAQKTSGSQA